MTTMSQPRQNLFNRMWVMANTIEDLFAIVGRQQKQLQAQDVSLRKLKYRLNRLTTYKAMKPMKAMTAKRTSNRGGMTAAEVYKLVAADMTRRFQSEFTPKDVKKSIEGVLEYTAAQLMRQPGRHFKVAGVLTLKLRGKPEVPARKGIHPKTKKPIWLKARPASRTVRALPTKKLKAMVN